MTNRKNWYGMARHYQAVLIYVAIVVTVGLILQIAHWKVSQ